VEQALLINQDGFQINYGASLWELEVDWEDGGGHATVAPTVLDGELRFPARSYAFT